MDSKILEIALRKLSEEFDRFIGKVEDGTLKEGDIKRAKACLPPYCERAFK
jgi:hypothetical protein